MRIPPRLLLLLPVLAATGCDSIDPYKREGVRRPMGANERNLAAMAVQPTDIVRGTGAAGGTGIAATAAMDRLRSDRVKPLPDTGLARIITIPGGSAGGGN